MRLRCHNCGAWKIGNHIIRRTPRTDICYWCDPEQADAIREAYKAQALARREEELPEVRRWLHAAPPFHHQLLIDARAAYPGPQHTPELARRVVPWADTIDLNTATDWLYTRIGKHLNVGQFDYPPATDSALSHRFADHHGGGQRYKDPGDSLDIPAIFGQRGFPYPPDTSDTTWSDTDVYIELIAAEQAWDTWHEANNHLAAGDRMHYCWPSQPRGADVLPDHYTDILTFELTETLVGGDILSGGVIQDEIRWERTAIGSIYREHPDHVVVLWH